MNQNTARDFTKEIILENNVVLLRPLLASDYEHLLPFARQEQDIWTYSMVQPFGDTGMKTYIDTALAARTKGTEYPFIIFDKRSKQYAGSTRFYDIQFPNKTTQLGYTWYGKAFQRTGLNRNCKLLLLQFAFEELELERVEFRADKDNARSIAAMKAIGCTVEGVLRSNTFKANGHRRDSIVLSILKHEWENGVKENLQQIIRFSGK